MNNLVNNVVKFLPALIILLILSLGSAGFFLMQYLKVQKEIQTIRTDPTAVQKLAQEEAKKLVSEVGKLIELPNEEPTVATITDAEKLKDQEFFKKAKNGDRVLIYTNAKKAILYSPTLKKVIDVAPVVIGTPSAQVVPAKIVLRNGAPSDLISKTETAIKKDFPQADIVKKEYSQKTDYEKSVVVVLNDAAKDAAETIAKQLNMEVRDLPGGEGQPKDADILIIIGKDQT